MAWSITSAYNGDFLEFMYLVLRTGNQAIEKGSIAVQTGIRTKRALPRLSQSAEPVGAYTTGVPGADTVTTTYAERSLVPVKGTLYETFIPSELLAIWDKWSSQGTMTELAVNPEFIADVLALYANNVGNQYGSLIWQGSVAGGDLFDGIVTLAAADGDVVDVTNVGVITQANVVDVFADMYEAMPEKFEDDPDYQFHTSTRVWRLLNLFNNDAKKGTVGVLDENVRNLFLNKRIVHYAGFPDNTILGAKGTAMPETSNLHFGTFVDIENEMPRIDRVNNAGEQFFVRANYLAGVNYTNGADLLLYVGS